MNEILKIIFGNFTGIQLFGYIWFFLIGYILYGLTEATGRDVKSPYTPEKWNWKFWFHDNWRRYLTTILCSYVLFRFYNEISGHSFGYIDAISIGLIGDGIAATLKKRIKAIGADREELMKENVADNLKSDQKITADNLKSDQKITADNLKSDQKITADKFKEKG
jgi:hypothetical protein